MVLSIIANIFPLFHLFTFCLKNTVERYLTETTTKITHVHAHAHARTHAWKSILLDTKDGTVKIMVGHLFTSALYSIRIEDPGGSI